jgi:hypothetical protein
MAALASDVLVSVRTNATNETSKVGEQSGGDSAVLSQAAIRWRCAFTYMNAVFRKNLTERARSQFERRATEIDTGAVFSGVTGIALLAGHS